MEPRADSIAVAVPAEVFMCRLPGSSDRAGFQLEEVPALAQAAEVGVGESR